MQWPVYRTIFLEPPARKFVEEVKDAQRFDEQWRGVDWILARKPESGLPRYLKEPTKYLIYVFPANELARTKELWVLYSYDEDAVTIHAVRFR